jgi:hypothetical protein
MSRSGQARSVDRKGVAAPRRWGFGEPFPEGFLADQPFHCGFETADRRLEEQRSSFFTEITLKGRKVWKDHR